MEERTGLDLAALAVALAREGASIGVLHVRGRWTGTGLHATAGAPVSWFAGGDDVASRLRARVGGTGPEVTGTGATHTFRAPRDGEVEFAAPAPGGRLAQLTAAGFDVVVAVWPPGADVGARLAGLDEPLLAREAARLEALVTPRRRAPG